MNQSKFVDVNQQPLRYRISDWRQLNKCLSNNSRELSIHTSVFVNDDRINGLRIQVCHSTFGILFACVLNAKGCMISKMDEGTTFEFTTGQILEELKKYGFLIEYSPVENLRGAQLQFLMTLNDLHYDKIRVMNVWTAPTGVKEFKTYVVAFMVEPNGDWLNANYSPSYTEFVNAIQAGTAMNISAISESKNFRWDWLYGWVGDIDDILEENSSTQV